MTLLRSLCGDSYWENIEKSKFSSKPVRVILDSGLLAIANLFVAFALQFANYRWVYIVLSILFFLGYLFFITYFAALDDYKLDKLNSEKDKIEKLKFELTDARLKLGEKENAIVGYEYCLSSIQATLEVTAQNINKLRYDLTHDGVSTDTVWDFKQTCALVCRDTYNLLNNVYKNNNFEVSYISFKRNSNGTASAYMNSYEPKNNEMPSIYQRTIIIPKYATRKEQKKMYCFEKLYLEGTSAPLILLDEEKVRRNFLFKNEEAKKTCKYKQYIAIPICCQSKKVIGMLQISALENNIIKGDEISIKKFLIAILRPIAYLTLLANKTQDCIDSITGGK